ncbi:retrovirus-related pol polyprotein from transposon TNT 1-94 [Tanacetum coccineum]
MLEKKVNTTPVDYAVLNQLSQDFETRFVPQTELSAEQAFWSQNYVNSPEPTLSSRPTKVEVPKELPKVSMVNTSLKKLKHHLAVISKDIVNIIVNSSVDNAYVNMHECEKCLKLETELLNKTYFIEKEIYDNMFKSYTTLEKHCISLEVDTQLNQEIFQRVNSVSNQSAPSFDQYFELNELKAQSQENDTVIKKLKERIKSLSGNMNDDKIKKDLEEIETINIELDHRVSKLIDENEHLKQTYKQLYDSIKPVRIRSKEQCDDLINQVNLKSVEISDLNASLQEKVLVITTLKDDLRKLKGKALVDNSITKHTSDPEMLKIDVEPITPKLLNKRTTHSVYIKHTQEEATVLRDLVEHIKSNYPLDHSLESDCSGCHPKEQGQKRVKPSTSASGSQPSSNTKKNKIQQTPSSTQKNKVEAHPKKVKYSLKNKDCVVAPKGTANVQYSKLNANSELKCVKITTTTEVPLRKPISLENETPKPVVTLVYSRKPRKSKTNVPVSKSKVVQIVLWYLDSGCSKHMTGDRSQLTNFVNKFLGTVKFRNDHVEKILGYGDYQTVNVTISRVYYVEGLGHNLFSIGQFCDSNLEVAFHQHTCFIRNLEGVDLLTGSRGNNLYTLSLRDMMASSLISRHGLVRGLPKLKFEKDHLCSACAMGKSKKKPYKPKSEDTNQEKLYLLHMDLCGPMRLASVNGKKYILVIVDDYSRFTWFKCLRSKDEAPYFIIKFLKMIQVRLRVPVRRIRTDNGIEFVNQTLREYYEKVDISHETSIARSPQQNEVVVTACYTQNHSIIRLRYGKTPYELLHDKSSDLSFFHVFGALCYLTNDSENLGKLQPKADIGIFIGYAPTKKAFQIYNRRTRRIIETIHVDFDELTAMTSEHNIFGPVLHEMTYATISSGLVPNPPTLTPFVPPSRTDWDILFQPLFDELLNPPSSVDRVDRPAPVLITPIAKVVAPEPVASPFTHLKTS